MCGPQGDHGVLWSWGGGCLQTVRRGAGHHDPHPRCGGEADRHLHLPGEIFIMFTCARSAFLTSALTTVSLHPGQREVKLKTFPTTLFYFADDCVRVRRLDICDDQADLVSLHFLWCLDSLHESAHINNLLLLPTAVSHHPCNRSFHVAMLTSWCDVAVL